MIYTDILVPSIYSQGTFCQAFHMATVLCEDGRSCACITKDTHTSKVRTQLLVFQVRNTTSSLFRCIWIIKIVKNTALLGFLVLMLWSLKITSVVNTNLQLYFFLFFYKIFFYFTDFWLSTSCYDRYGKASPLASEA